MISIEEKEGSISIDGLYTEKDLQALCQYPAIETLSLTGLENVTVKVANGFTDLKSVKKLFLWSSVNRTAMRHIISIPKLETLDILEVRSPGRLVNFSKAVDLKIFRCNHYMSEADLLEIATLPNLQELSAHNARVTKASLMAILKLPYLKHLDLEATPFTDAMAKMLAASKTIKQLSVGASQLSAKGLCYLAGMSQLESLDIWAIDIQEQDLACLSELKNLEYLSIGGYEGQTSLTFEGVMPHISQMPSLKHLWFDGITLTDAERLSMENKYSSFRN